MYMFMYAYFSSSCPPLIGFTKNFGITPRQIVNKIVNNFAKITGKTSWYLRRIYYINYVN